LAIARPALRHVTERDQRCFKAGYRTDPNADSAWLTAGLPSGAAAHRSFILRDRYGVAHDSPRRQAAQALGRQMELRCRRCGRRPSWKDP